MKAQLSKPLGTLLAALAATVPVQRHCEASTSILEPAAAVFAGMIGPIFASMGSANVVMEISKFQYQTTTSYHGVSTSSLWVSEMRAGTMYYKRVFKATGVGSSVDSTSTNAFTIALGGSDGDIPFCVRKHKCVDKYNTYGVWEDYVYTTDAFVIYKVTHKYVTSPAAMASQSRARIRCTQWDRERSNCNEVNGKMDQDFYGTIANNGVSYISIPGSLDVNMSAGDSHGVGITWGFML